MNNFKVIYRILRTLERQLDTREFDPEVFDPDLYGITPERMAALWEMLVVDGYVTGVSIIRSLGSRGVKLSDPRITLKGLEYLEENGMMKKASSLLKGAVDIIK